MRAVHCRSICFAVALCNTTAAVLRGRSSSELSHPAYGRAARLTDLVQLLGGLHNHAVDTQAKMDQHHQTETNSLMHDIQQAKSSDVREVLMDTASSSSQGFKDTSLVYENLQKFSKTMVDLLMQTTGNGFGCESSKCGAHSSCTDTPTGPQCICNEGYIGLGHDCHAPPEFLPHPLVQEGSAAPPTRAADMNVCLFGGDKIAVVFRDVSRGGVGQIVLGGVREAGVIDLSPPEQFTVRQGKAFAPVVTGTGEGRILVAWRDGSRGGAGWIRGASVGRGGGQRSLAWGQPVSIASDQTHKMALVSFDGARVALMFSGRERASHNAAEVPFGGAVLAAVGTTGAVNILGQFRFTDSAVCRLEVVKVSDTSFVIAARAGKEVDDLNASHVERQEAIAIFGELADNDLVFDPNQLNLAPATADIWARGLSRIAQNTVGYAYQEGASMVMKMAMIEIKPKAPAPERMQVIHRPTIIHNGFSPYVSMLSDAYMASDPHTLIYYDSDQRSMINLCSWNAQAKTLSRCEDFPWLEASLQSVSGVALGGGKSLMAFTMKDGIPYYTIFGLSHNSTAL